MPDNVTKRPGQFLPFGPSKPTCTYKPLIGAGLSKLDEFEKWIIQKESSFNPLAKNPHSSAFGLGQLTQANRNALGAMLGINPNSTSIDDQIALFKAYIQQRFQTSEAAYNYWLAHGSY